MSSPNHKKTLLLVEDEVIIALAKQKALGKYGYKVLIINTGEKAVIAAKENKTIDLILMDIDLGKGIDGTEAAEQILKDQDIPIVFLSSHTDPEIVYKTEKITSYGYVVKSSSITVLDASIKMAFKLFNSLKKLEQSENDYKDLFNNSSDSIYIQNRDGYFLDVNQGAVKMYGYPKEYFLGEKPELLSAPGKNDLEKVSRIREEAFNGNPTEYEFWGIRKNGEIFPKILRTQSGFYKGQKVIITHATDITERKKMEAKCHRSEELYKSIIKYSPDIIAVTDNKGYIQILSPNTYNMFRVDKPENFIGRSVMDFMIPEDREKARHNISRISRNALHGPKEYRGLRADGTTFDLEINGSFIYDTNGQPQQMIFIVRDITEWNRGEDLRKNVK